MSENHGNGRLPSFRGGRALWASPRLAQAMRDLAGYTGSQPDLNLSELRAALLGTGFTWSAGGKLAYSPDQLELINELDRLIETLGGNTRAAELLL